MIWPHKLTPLEPAEARMTGRGPHHGYAALPPRCAAVKQVFPLTALQEQPTCAQAASSDQRAVAEQVGEVAAGVSLPAFFPFCRAPCSAQWLRCGCSSTLRPCPAEGDGALASSPPSVLNSCFARFRTSAGRNGRGAGAAGERWSKHRRQGGRHRHRAARMSSDSEDAPVKLGQEPVDSSGNLRMDFGVCSVHMNDPSLCIARGVEDDATSRERG